MGLPQIGAKAVETAARLEVQLAEGQLAVTKLKEQLQEERERHEKSLHNSRMQLELVVRQRDEVA